VVVKASNAPTAYMAVLRGFMDLALAVVTKIVAALRLFGFGQLISRIAHIKEDVKDNEQKRREGEESAEDSLR
jgi:hypothetical protein